MGFPPNRHRCRCSSPEIVVVLTCTEPDEMLIPPPLPANAEHVPLESPASPLQLFVDLAVLDCNRGAVTCDSTPAPAFAVALAIAIGAISGVVGIDVHIVKVKYTVEIAVDAAAHAAPAGGVSCHRAVGCPVGGHSSVGQGQTPIVANRLRLSVR